MRVLDHDDGRVDHRADGDGNAAEAHDVGADAEELHGNERHQYPNGEHQDGDQRAPDVQQEDDAHQRHDQAFFEQRRIERGDGTVDQLRPVVDRHDLRSFGQRRQNLLDPVFDVVDDGQRIGAEALQRDAACRFAVAVEFGDAAPFIARKFNAGHVLKQHRGAAVRLHDDIFDVVDAFEVAATAHHELVFGKFQRAPADVHVAAANDVADFCQRNTERAQAARIDDDVVLLDEAADARNFGHALGLGEAEANVPILQRAQIRKRLVLTKHRVLIDPADAGGVGSERWRRRPPAIAWRRRSGIRARASVPSRCRCRPRR